ncbi:MAG: type 1 glutamine amidotransferase domain-containing protein [Bacteroidota bacterium]
MSKTRKVVKWSIISITALIVSVICFGVWFMNLIPAPEIPKSVQKEITPSQISYLTDHQIPNRGKILAVVTSVEKIGNTEKNTGYELSELARAYYVFQANGFDVIVASTVGGKAPMVIDKDDMRAYDYAFLNDSVAMNKVNNTIAIENVNPDAYQAIYFVGGKGAMFDFPKNKKIQHLVQNYYESGKVVGAVCHGPSALINVTLSNGQPLLTGKEISAFTNEEELLLIPEAKEIFPFLLQDQLAAKGANFNKGIMYLNQVSLDGNLVTGQNPWSTWGVAENMIRQMGYEPKYRKPSSEENTIGILKLYENRGYHKAKKKLDEYCKKDSWSVDRELLGIHALLAAYQFRLAKSTELTMLLSHSNKYL